jgi:hypothetical protein
MVGSTLQWGHKRQLSRVILSLTLSRSLQNDCLALVGRGNRRQGGGARSVGHDASQATAHLERQKHNHKLCGGEITKTPDAQQPTI